MKRGATEQYAAQLIPVPKAGRFESSDCAMKRTLCYDFSTMMGLARMNVNDGNARRLIEGRIAEVKLFMERLRSGDATSVILDQTSVGRLSRMDTLQQVAMSAGYQASLGREYRRLQAALARLDEGTFGLCCKCGEVIPPDRLAADLSAPFCAGCQLSIEASPADRRASR